MVHSNFSRLPYAPEFAEQEDPLDDGIEIRWRAVAWRVAGLLVCAVFLALIWIGVVAVYGWIAQ